MTKKVSKIVLYFFLSLTAFLAALAGYTQIGAFRENLRSTLYELVKNNLNADVYIGEINGNLVTGFTIDTLIVYIDNSPFVETGKISVRYNILELLNNKVNIDTVRVENPTVHLFRWKNGDWNIDRLVKPSASTDTTPSPWVIEAGKISLVNASFRLVDSTGAYSSSTFLDGRRLDSARRKVINFSNVNVNSIELDANAYYSSDRLRADIHHLSFVSPAEDFTLKKLSTGFTYADNSVRVKDLTITTPNSKLVCSVDLSGVNVFTIGDLQELRDAQTKVTVVSSSVASRDVQTFLPELYFLNGQVFIDALFQGTFEQLAVKKLDASFANTTLRLTGTVSNIHVPKELRLNIVSKQSVINPPDVPELMPYFGIPNYSQLGPLTVDFQFVGKPLDFMVVSTLKSSAGTVTIDGEMVITEENIQYKGLLAGNDVHLEKFFETSEVASRLNAKAFIEGSGTSIDQLNTEARIEIDSSIFHGIPVSSAALEMKAKEKRVDVTLAVASPAGNILANGTINFHTQTPSYTLSTQVRGLNLSPILRDDYYNSRLSFDMTHTADNYVLLEGDSRTQLNILPSTFRTYFIDSSKTAVEFFTDSTRHSRLVVQSPIADGEIEGTFTFSGFLSTVNSSIRQFNQLYSYQRHVVDSSFAAVHDSLTGMQTEDSSFHRMKYAIQIKNLQPVALFFNLPMFDVQGLMKGSLSGNEHNTSLVGTMDLQRGVYVQNSTAVQAKQFLLSYNIADQPKSAINQPLPLKVELVVEGKELQINNTRLYNPKLDLNLNESHGIYRINTDIDTTISIGVEGSLSIHADEERFVFSKLHVKYQGYDLENAGDVTAALSQQGVSVDSALFLHLDQTMMLHGTYTFDGTVTALAAVTNFDFSDIHYFSTSTDFRENALAFGGTVHARAELTGTVDDPRFAIDVKGSDLSYERTSLGNLNGTIIYVDGEASVNVEMSRHADSANFRDVMLSGIIPIDLRIIDVPDRFGEPGLNVMLSSANLQMSALDPFIPELKNMSGIIRSDIHITGSLEDPRFKGTAKLDSGHFVFEMTGLSYIASGTLELNENTVSFPDFQVTNLSSDYTGGGMSVGGFVVMKGFAPEEYHLNAKGELLVLRERSRTQNSTFFGTVVASTGNDNIRFDGTFYRSRITGVVYIQQAFLTFPPTQQASLYSSSLINAVEFVDDTSKPVLDSASVESLTNFIQQATVVSHTNERTFLDGFGYDLTIQTRGSVRVNMIFNANAGAYEELYAELNGKLTLVKDESGVLLNGEINVGNESNYTFYKKFNASGSLKFVGDPQNPQLDILATYEGTHSDINNPNKEDRVIVTLQISGTRIAPQLKIGLKTIDQTGKETPRTGDVENDAISFLLTSSPGTAGKFRDELTVQDRDRISEQLASTIGGTFINSLLSGYVMEFIQHNNIPFVKVFEVRQVGADPDVRIGAEVLDAYVNVGGRVFSDVNNANISVQIPLGDRQKRNFMLEVEKKTENFDYTIQARTILGARIYYRFTF